MQACCELTRGDCFDEAPYYSQHSIVHCLCVSLFVHTGATIDKKDSPGVETELESSVNENKKIE